MSDCLVRLIPLNAMRVSVDRKTRQKPCGLHYQIDLESLPRLDDVTDPYRFPLLIFNFR